jgi:hypothetical protein
MSSECNKLAHETQEHILQCPHSSTHNQQYDELMTVMPCWLQGSTANPLLPANSMASSKSG